MIIPWKGLSLEQKETTLSLIEESYLNVDGQRAEFSFFMKNEVCGWITCEVGGGFFTFWVSEQYQNQGIATKLLEALILKGCDLKWEHLIADAIHPATIKICQKLGFKKDKGSNYILILKQGL